MHGAILHFLCPYSPHPIHLYVLAARSQKPNLFTSLRIHMNLLSLVHYYLPCERQPSCENGPCFHSCPSILNLSSSPGVIALKYKLPVVAQRIKNKFCTIAYKPSIIWLLTILYSHRFSPFPSLFILQPPWPSLCSSNSPKLAPTWECGSAYSSAGCQILTASATSFHSAHGEHRYLTSMLLPWPPCWNQSLLLFYCFISLIIIDNYLVSLKKKLVISILLLEGKSMTPGTLLPCLTW